MNRVYWDTVVGKSGIELVGMEVVGLHMGVV